MPADVIGREEGRRVFGSDPETYDRARPGHAERVYEILVQRCGLGAGTSVLEIGPGTGQATRRLLALGANPLVAVEPDPQLAEYLTTHVPGDYDVLIAPLEHADLRGSSFDLAAAASSFHWIDEATGLAALFDALRPGGWAALWWTGFGDPEKPDPFHDATRALMDGMPRSPVGSHRSGRMPREEGSARWLSALERAGFVDVTVERIPWSKTFDAKGIREIFSTFSPLLVVDEELRTRTLDELERIAREEFGDEVEKPIVTALYTARKPS
jgi:SAM-dependent methyltransferase